MEFQSHKEEILEIASQYKINIRKKQGQCFLVNENIVDYILKKAKLNPDSDIVLEIGPGFGSLTQKLIMQSKYVYAIEIDQRIAHYLHNKFKDKNNLTLFTQDALKSTFPPHTKLISNVPYHISGPLIQKIISSKEKAETIILMLQEDFIHRILASPQPKGYGRLSVLAQLLFHIEELRKVSRMDFFPQPEVESGIIELTFQSSYSENPLMPHFIEFLAAVFPYKNKIITKALVLMQKNLANFPKLQYLKDLSIQDELPLEIRNKRIWQLTPFEIWDLFRIIRSA